MPLCTWVRVPKFIIHIRRSQYQTRLQWSGTEASQNEIHNYLYITRLSTYLPTLVFVYAGQSHSFCKISLAFARQYCMAVLLGENLDLRLANSESS